MTYSNNEMILHATHRGPVEHNGEQAALICWKPWRTNLTGQRHRRNTARIEYPNGRQRTVKASEIRKLEPDTNTRRTA